MNLSPIVPNLPGLRRKRARLAYSYGWWWGRYENTEKLVSRLAAVEPRAWIHGEIAGLKERERVYSKRQQ